MLGEWGSYWAKLICTRGTGVTLGLGWTVLGERGSYWGGAGPYWCNGGHTGAMVGYTGGMETILGPGLSLPGEWG